MSSSGRPTRDQVLLMVATVFAERSTCSRANVGCVIAREGRILTTGYNGAPAGMPHCEHTEQGDWVFTHDPGMDMRYKQRGGEMGCQVSVHAEANAIAFAARHGIETEGADLFCTMSPCIPCAKLVINAGIRRVVCVSTYRDPSAIMLLKAASIETQVFVSEQTPPTPSP